MTIVADKIKVPTYSIEYLIIGAGGGGGNHAHSDAGGGGGGGYRSSCLGAPSGGGRAFPEVEFKATVGQVYTITVGGAGGTAADGGNSAFANIIAYGGGGAGNHRGHGQPGGSGGGSNGQYSGDQIDGGYGFPGQGYEGGHHGGYPGGGGGGGASAAGTSNGHGGAGQWSLIDIGYTGYNATAESQRVYRAGGGGAYQGGTGGSGGGGQGWPNSAGNRPGATNTGGGGGGNQTSTPNGTPYGGSGIVILKMLTSNYSGTTTGSPTVTTLSSDLHGNAGAITIVKFTGAGSYTA